MSSGPIGEAVALSFYEELNRVLAEALDLGEDTIHLKLPPYVILDAEIVFAVASLPSQLSWAGLVNVMDDAAPLSNLMHGQWAEDENSLSIWMGLGIWNSTRADRLPGSRVLSILNNGPLDSPQRKQLVRLVQGRIPDRKGKATAHAQSATIRSLQLLRLNTLSQKEVKTGNVKLQAVLGLYSRTHFWVPR